MKILQTYIRVYVTEMNDSLKFYEELLGETATLRFTHPVARLELAVVGNILILAGSNEALTPFRSTQATLKVDSIHQFHKFLVHAGCKVIRDLSRVATGTNLTVQHPDGSIFEYVEHHR